MSDVIKKMLSQNKTWAKEQIANKADYFDTLASGQTPSIFWIGCCDSRVIPSEILKAFLGDIFVQTNIANQVCENDPNTMSSLEYAVNVLKVDHIVVCGHTFCGGIAAGMCDTLEHLPKNIQQWLTPIQQLYQSKKSELPSEDETARATALSVLNVHHQVDKISRLELIQKATPPPQIHGWLFQLESGTIESIC